MSRIFTVRELTEAMKNVVEGEFPFVRVKGQVGSLTRAGSGHVYFSLRDESSLLQVVWFRSSRYRQVNAGGDVFDPLTGEVLEDAGDESWLEQGSEVLCAGRLQVYAPRGIYQLVAELVQEEGIGDLHQRFEELKKELASQGYFDPSRKRPLPLDAKRVAVVTAPSGAAVRDFLTIGAKRGTGSRIRIYPSLVQGEQAPDHLVRAMNRCTQDAWAEVLVLIRGGGSLEDLWAFNTREVAEAVFHSPIPVLVGVGHEIDVSIADLAADQRASTPSHAAQLLWPEKHVLMQTLDETQIGLDQAWSSFLKKSAHALAVTVRELNLLSPAVRLERLQDEWAAEARRLQRAVRFRIENQCREIDHLQSRLKYCLGDAFWDFHKQRMHDLDHGLRRAVKSFMQGKQADFDILDSALSGLDPLQPLKRGYALAYSADGEMATSARHMTAGRDFNLKFHDGRVEARALDVMYDTLDEKKEK